MVVGGERPEAAVVDWLVRHEGAVVSVFAVRPDPVELPSGLVVVEFAVGVGRTTPRLFGGSIEPERRSFVVTVSGLSVVGVVATDGGVVVRVGPARDLLWSVEAPRASGVGGLRVAGSAVSSLPTWLRLGR